MSSLRTVVRSSDLGRVWYTLVARDPLTACVASRGMTGEKRGREVK